MDDIKCGTQGCAERPGQTYVAQYNLQAGK